MAHIQIMNEHLANKIAAGEVVERPAAVVKELVENAIDAGSTQIEVSVTEAGLEKIRVTDNGEGLDRQDACLAFERHATSKLKTDQDLFRIATLGFRGEALPSIAAVSHVSLQTWNGLESTGTKIFLQGGEVKEVTDAPLRQGTIVEVSQLFYNTPARYKYLKSVHTELSHISDYLNRLALAHPSIAFSLVHNGRELLSTNGKGQLLAVIASIYGLQVAKKMISIQASTIDFQLEGFISQPEITRSNRSYISILINGRYVKNSQFAHLIQRAYHTRLPIHRFPIVALNITMDPSLVDSNVHPTKLEVRLSKEKELSEWLVDVLEQHLQQKQEIPSPLAVKTKHDRLAIIQEQLDLQLPQDKRSKQLPSVSSLSSASARTSAIIRESGLSFPLEHMEHQQPLEKADYMGNAEVNEETAVKEVQTVKTQVEEGADPKKEKIPLLFPLAQLHGTYILAQNEQGLYMIDQHAAQERIWYEHYYQLLNNPPRENQGLLVPIVLECSPAEVAKIEENMHFFEELGLFLEEFGHHAYIIRSHPSWFPKGEEEQLTREIVDFILEGQRKVEWIIAREKVAIMISCKQSIKANQYLSPAEMEALLEQLRHTSNPFTCPHGRPITVLLTTYDIEKMFKRVM